MATLLARPVAVGIIRIFPHRPVNEKQVAISTGLMNIGASAIGGVPMCHGAGGMAGHIRFGATTDGAPMILGLILIVLALFFGGSIATLLKWFPPALLGVILFLTGTQLALGSCEFSKGKGERFVTIVTAAFAIWNAGIAFVAGAAICYSLKRRWIRLNVAWARRLARCKPPAIRDDGVQNPLHAAAEVRCG